jgi:hypothetical protein
MRTKDLTQWAAPSDLRRPHCRLPHFRQLKMGEEAAGSLKGGAPQGTMSRMRPPRILPLLPRENDYKRLRGFGLFFLDSGNCSLLPEGYHRRLVPNDDVIDKC